jgi:hypothetical protein
MVVNPPEEQTQAVQACASGIVSNAFGIRDNQGVEPLSLPPGKLQRQRRMRTQRWLAMPL